MNLRHITHFFFFFFFVAVQSQELLPYVENFTKNEYNGDNQNWNISQGDDNAMYFANNHYLLRYNGVKWEKYALPNNTVIRSVFIEKEKVYTGSYKEFGYWKRIAGKMKYYSLTKDKNLFSGSSENEEIWKIFKFEGKIYFQSFNELYIYGDGAIEKIKLPFQISYCYVVENQLYVASVRNGVYLKRGKSFIKKQNWNMDNNVIHNIQKADGKLYVFTKTNGVYFEENNKLVAWGNPLNQKLKSEIIVAARFLTNNKLAIGTGLEGLYIVDLVTGSFLNINRKNAIKNNAILSIAVDKDKDLWLGLDNGIAHVEINSAIKVFSDNAGILGSVYSLATMDHGYLFVTNHGIFIHKDKQLHRVPGSEGQVWDIYKRDNEFVIGHNDGTFVFDGAKLKRVNPVNGGWKFLKSRFDNVYFQSHYSGIAYYPDTNDLTNYKFLEKLTKPIRDIAQNKPNELWAADNYRSLYKITYDANFKTTAIQNVSQKNGISNDYGVKIFTYKNEILFLINKTWYTYNSISDKLIKDELFNKSFKNISDIIPVDDANFIVLNDGLLYVISQVDNEFYWELIPKKYYEGKLIIEYSKVYKDNNTILLNLDDGFISYELGKPKNKIPTVTVEAFYQGHLIDENTTIKYNQSVEVNIIPNSYGYRRQDLYFKLNHSVKYTRIIGGDMVLNNLHSGKQQLVFYYFDGKKYVVVGSYKFDVHNPWYFSIWMVLVYILVISGSFFLYYKWNQFRYVQKLQIREEELRHQKKILEIELKAENELNVQEYEKHILELEIQAKNSEVAGKSLSIAKQSEMIDSIQQILDVETDFNRLKSEVKKVIKINAVNKHEWETFETNLNQIHNEFISKLTQKYPMLTAKDIKLCIYLRMNLSSKEIAPMMNISFRGVELHRYRLRKKLTLSQEENLSMFMLTI